MAKIAKTTLIQIVFLATLEYTFKMEYKRQIIRHIHVIYLVIAHYIDYFFNIFFNKTLACNNYSVHLPILT